MVSGTGPLKANTQYSPLVKLALQTESANAQPSIIHHQDLPIQSQNRVGSYISDANSEPDSVKFGSISRPSLLDDLHALRGLIQNQKSNNVNDLKAVPENQENRFNQVAKDLGFKDSKTMQYALRNLSNKGFNQFLSQLEESTLKQAPSDRTSTKMASQTKILLQNQITTELKHMFSSAQIPAPKFEPPEQWPLQGTLAAFNAFSEIKQSQGVQIFEHLAQQKNGDALTFKLDQNQVDFDSDSSAIQTLTSAMLIAQSEHETGVIRLHPAALSVDPQDILSHQPVQTFLSDLKQNKPQAVKSLQELLNYALPTHRKLGLTGKMNTKTHKAVKEFQYQQILKQVEDLIGDDFDMPSERKSSFKKQLANIRSHINKVSLHPQNEHLIKNLIRRIKDHPSTGKSSKERLNTLESQLAERLNGKFNETSLKHLVQNWFGMIDGGQEFNFSEQVITHELGHILQNGSEVLQNWRQISWDGKEAELEDIDSIMGETLHSEGHEHFVSDYALVNDQEDFAESYRLFTHQPERLLQANLMKFMLLSAITGKYEGKESQLLNLVEKNGYKKIDLDRTVLRLRGQLEAASRDNINQIADNTIDTLSKVGNPLLGYALEKADEFYNLRDKIGNWWTDLKGYQDGPQFTPKMASALSSMDEILGIETAHLTTHPNQSGFVLDFLTRNQAIIHNPNASHQEKQQAKANLKSFSANGTDVFPTEVKDEIPAQFKERFKGESGKQERAIALSMAYILGRSKTRASHSDNPKQSLGERFLSAFSSTKPAPIAHDQKFHITSLIRDIRNNPKLLTNILDKESTKHLPQSFLALLAEPHFVQEITGQAGDTHLSASLIQDYVTQEVQERSESSSQPTLDKRLKNILKMQKYTRLRKGGVIYDMYKNMVNNYNTGVLNKAPILSETHFETALDQVIKTAQDTLESATKSTPQPLKSDLAIEEHFMEALKIRQNS